MDCIVIPSVLAERRGVLIRLSLSQRLPLLIFAAMTPLLIALIYILLSLRSTRETEINHQVFQDGKLATLEIQRIVTGFESVLVTLSAAPAVQKLDSEACITLLSETSRRLAGVDTIGFIDKTGVLRCRQERQGSGVDLQDRAYFQEALKTHRLVLGTYLKSRVTGKKTLPMALRVMDTERNILGVMALSIDLHWLQNRLAERSYADGASITVADKEGVIIARYPFPEKFVGNAIPEGYKYLVNAERPGTLEVQSQDGTRRALAYFPVTSVPVGLYVSTGLSTTVAFAPVLSAMGIAVASAIAATLLTLLLTWQTSRYAIGVPLARLTATLERWQQGDRSHRTGMAPDGEFGQIGAAIDNFIDRLNEANAQQELLVGELGHRVKNILAVVTSVARQTFNDRDGQDKFAARLAAMGSAFDLLASGPGTSADLYELVLAATSPFDGGERFKVKGSRQNIDQKSALAFVMAIHELCTNAAKYGAISVPGGSVDIEWTVATDGSLTFKWKERDGPLVATPSTKGFGTSMIERIWAQQVNGRVTTSFDPAGFSCTLVMGVVTKSTE